MKQIWLAVSFALSLNACAASLPANLGEHKTQLYAYEKSGTYQNDVQAVISEAQAYIVDKAHQVQNPAIVLDIDETSLSNWPQLAANDFTFRLDGACDHLPRGPCGLAAWQKLARAEPVPGMPSLFHAARENGVAVFFITGRDESVRRATVQNLKKAGYSQWQQLVMRPAGTTTPSAADYKAPQRAKIEAMGYTIIANIGDQPSDLSGGHAIRSFLIPNPFYRIQ